jgi:membrane dipeptidase
VDNLDEYTLLQTEIEEANGGAVLASNAEEIRAAKEQGAAAIILGGTFKAIGDDIGALKLYRKLGMRTFALSLNPRNLLIDGCGERNASGLSYLGIKAVKEMERLGVLIDISHASEKGFWDVLEFTRCPVFASHSNCRAVNDNPRNLTDKQIEALVRRGGLVALSTYPTLVSQNPQPTLDDYLDHVDHLKRLVGADYISIGTDFIDYVYDFVDPGVRKSDPTKVIYGEEKRVVKGLEDISRLENIKTGLQTRGYTGPEIEAILSGNFLRLLKSMES